MSTESSAMLASEKPLRVVVTMDHAPPGMELLSPGARCEWGRCRFLINPPPGTEADFWIVAGNGRPADWMTCSPKNTLFIAAEPLEKKLYPRQFYQQFHWVVDSHDQSRHPRLSIDALGLCWHIGMQQPGSRYAFGYDVLASLPCPAKENRISVVCSHDRFTPGQRLRLDFLHEAKRQLGDQIVHFGRGFQPIADKLDAILPYRFHLTLENCQQTFYWTEKIADAYLAWAYPLYVGCPNLAEFIPASSFLRIDPGNPQASIAAMQRALASEVTAEEQSAVAAGRNAVLNVFNPFAVWSGWAERRWQPAASKRTVLRSHKAYRSMLRGLFYRWRMRNWRPDVTTTAKIRAAG
jgi:hypothetical protein